MSTPKKKYLVYAQPLIEEAEIEEVVRSMRAAWLGTGPKVEAFEKLVADYKGVKHAVAVNSCTAGLHLACLVAGLQPGDEVITTALTFCATVNAIIHSGATPVLADIDPQTMNMDFDDVVRRITPRSRAIMPVHFAGRPCDMDRLGEIARLHGLTVIEDCAHAIETEYHGRKAGTFGQCGVLSFYSTKNIVTGEGGMVLTNDDEVAARVRMLALHGMSQDAWKRFSDSGYRHYEVREVGFKYNMMDMQAAIGLHQIPRVDEYWKRRRVIWDRFNAAFVNLPVQRPTAFEPETRHALHLYTLLINGRNGGVDRDGFISALHQRNVGTGVHYRAIPVHPVYQQRFGWKPEDYPNAHAVGQTTVSLPISAKLTDDDVEIVIAATREVLC